MYKSREIIYIALTLAIIGVIGVIYFGRAESETRKLQSIIHSFTKSDIQYLDDSVSSTTLVKYRDYKERYKNVRSNVIKAFDNDYFTMQPDSMYIDTKLSKEGDLNRVRLIGWPKVNEKEVELTIVIEYIARRNGIQIIQISSDEELFGRIFFGE
ncbi:MAG: hypothetical protein GX800_03185 [Clostridiaceae bacterium]|nr:hypothetical protein [Clostridiaceae bacterium]